MADDGENLTVLQINPVTVSAADWPGVIDIMAAGIEELRRRVEGEPGVGSPDQPPGGG